MRNSCIYIFPVSRGLVNFHLVKEIVAYVVGHKKFQILPLGDSTLNVLKKNITQFCIPYTLNLLLKILNCFKNLICDSFVFYLLITINNDLSIL